MRLFEMKWDRTASVAAAFSLICVAGALGALRAPQPRGQAAQSAQPFAAGPVSGVGYAGLDAAEGAMEMRSTYRGELIGKISGLDLEQMQPQAGNLLKPKGFLTSRLADKYKIMENAAEHIVNSAFEAGRRNGVDPMLVLAVAATESRFNPISQSGSGAMGMMQVIPKYHYDAIAASGGMDSLMDIRKATYAGSAVLKKYMNKAKGNAELALTLYNGSISDESRSYAKKVLGLREMFKRWYDQ